MSHRTFNDPCQNGDVARQAPLDKPHTLDLFKRGDMGSRDAKVLSVIWQDGDAVVVLHRGGS
jgi:hypothetical protein